MQETLDLALELNCEFANFYSAMAYPGSPLYERALRRGLAAARELDRLLAALARLLPLPTRHLTAGEVLRFRDEAFHTYYTSPRYLDMVRGAASAPTSLREVQAMTSHRLERRFAA